MGAQTILIIRHGEKPEPGGAKGIDETGTPDDKSLTPRGWQRAGAWAELFVPSLGAASALPKPGSIFASAPTSHAEIKAGQGGSKSRRPLETVSSLALKVPTAVDQRFSRGQEAELASTIAEIDGVVLVCWQHEGIASIATAIAPAAQGIPAGWPGDRFNVIFRLDRPDKNSAWAFKQIVPVMLRGDKSEEI